ncbi:hypothetical protein [Nocardioides sp. Soil774]|uniref:hypothetical protein n=1 Tax=Nocardioides sp. Soil774 TaxID=1736408 RepID=UPI0012F8B767|nr:hypothetical protein [Nocardioides sp. Soil774]
MTAELISSPSSTRRARWSGRASQHRRRQVGADAASEAQVEALWSSLVEVLRAMDDPSCAVLCTATGTPVAAYGLPKPEVPRVSRAAGTAFATHSRHDAGPSAEVETVELTTGRAHTVIASVPGAGADHLLAVTAEGVSPPLLEAWTRRAAEDLGEALSGPVGD